MTPFRNDRLDTAALAALCDRQVRTSAVVAALGKLEPVVIAAPATEDATARAPRLTVVG